MMVFANTTRESVDRFRSVARSHFGLDFDERKCDFLAELLQQRIDACRMTPGSYLAHLETHLADAEWDILAQALTVAETYFFRHREQLEAFSDVVLPKCMKARDKDRGIEILSAGCASGEEAYSLAILIRNGVAIDEWKTSILGIDVNPSVIDKAKSARYSPWSLRDTPEAIQRRWFCSDGRHFILDDKIRTMVRFERHNLMDDDPDIFRAEKYDVVFFRNVFMYFSPDHARSIIARITQSLVPGGYLFLGHAETLRGMSHDYHLCHTHGAFYYQRKDHIESRSPALVRPSFTAESVDSLGLLSADDSWIEHIGQASARIRTLTDAAPTAGSVPSESSAPAIQHQGMLSAIDLLRRERYSEALAAFDTLPPKSAEDADALLLKAALLVHNGRLDEAEETARFVLELNEFNAGAQYVLALCREAIGDFQGAVEHDQAAAYLDSDFAMPRLHLGLLALRANDRETARRELGHALTLLEREDAPRMLLFGGGFSREVLHTLCSVQLKACGGAP